MIPKRPVGKRRLEPVVAQNTTWVRAPISGMLISGAALGTRVVRNEVLGVIGDPFGEREKQVLSPVSGIIVGRLNLPLVHGGDALFNIASFDGLARFEPSMENLAADLVEEDFRA